ncbi:MAG TPA: 6-phosphogluconolactonase [Polyangiales bacterium]|nr:6-phosphogluconolactonase [Polyangiales bacterium]
MSVSRDSEALMSDAALRIATLGEYAIAQNGRFRWALAGGNTPRKLYSLLARPPLVRRIDWSRVEFFWGDERCVPPDHAESNYRMAREALLDLVQPDASRVHRIRGEDGPERAAAAYAAELQHAFALAADAPPPSFDLITLGMGADGHTASLFPGSELLQETRRWVGADRGRVTLTLPVLNAAAHVLFVVSGADKAERLAQVLGGPDSGLPSQRVRPERGKLEWFVDAAAAASLAPE